MKKKNNAELAESIISPKPWPEILNKDENPFVWGGFLHLALTGTISKGHCELNRECGDFRVGASLSGNVVRLGEEGSSTRSTTARLRGSRRRERAAEGVKSGSGLRLGARVVAARLEAAHEAAALEQHGVGLAREAGRDGRQAVEEEAVDLEQLVGVSVGGRARVRAEERREELKRAAEEREEPLRERAYGGRVGRRGRRRLLLLLGLLRRPLRRRLGGGVRVRGGQVGGEGLEVGGKAGVEAGAGGRGGEGGEEVVGGGLHRRVRVGGFFLAGLDGEGVGMGGKEARVFADAAATPAARQIGRYCTVE